MRLPTSVYIIDRNCSTVKIHRKSCD